MRYFGLEMNRAVGEALLAAVLSGRFPHTCIIDGGTAEFRSTLAKKLSSALVCTGDGEHPCGECTACHKALNGIHPDVLVYREDAKKKQLPVDEAREIIRNVATIPNEADVKISVIETEHPLSAATQNALLKILEEPPAYAYFILLCPSKASLLPTVLSRAQVFSLGDAGEVDEAEARAAFDAALEVAKAVTASDEFSVLRAASVFEKDKDKLYLSLSFLEEIFVEAMKAKCAVPADKRFEGVPELMAGRFTAERLERLRSSVPVLRASIDHNGNYNLILTRLCTLLRAQ